MTEEGTRTLVVLPRVRIQQHGFPLENFCKVGPVTIWRDSDALWPAQFQRPRPSWLKIFREFPVGAIKGTDHASDLTSRVVQLEELVCSHGSVITCNDPNWLRKNIDHLVSVVYFLAEPSGDFVRPAECFEFFVLNPDASQSDLVGLHTKAGEIIESAGSLILTPSLPLRAANRIAPLRLDLDCCQELVKCFEDEPNNRLVVACRHFFRASFDGIFQSPWEQDIAAYCACLEAAFDIPEGKYKEALMDKAEELLGKNETLRQMIAGAYAIRSELNHGAIAIEGDHRTELLNKFREHPGINRRTLRHICAFAIQERLLDSADARQTAIDRAIRRKFSHDLERIEQRFMSNDMWKELTKRFADKAAANAIAQLDPDGQAECIVFLCRFLKSHCWTFSTERPTQKKFVEVLRTMACSFGLMAREAKNTELECRGQSLFEAVRDRQMDRLEEWIRQNAPRVERIKPDTLHEAIYSATVQFSKLLDDRGYKSEVESFFSVPR